MSKLTDCISEVVTNLNNIANNTQNEQERNNCLSQSRLLFAQWEDVIRQQVDKRTSEYRRVLAALKKARQATKDALEDISKISKAIKQTAKGIQAIATLLGTFA